MEKQESKKTKKRSRRYSSEEIKDFELAGGVEGGMPAGQAGGPGEGSSVKQSKTPRKESGKPAESEGDQT